MAKRVAVLIMAGVLTAGLWLSRDAVAADVDVHIGIGVGIPAPRVVIPAPPSVFLIPGSYVYYAPEAGAQIFFYSGYWYLLDDGYWFRSSHYRGPWTYLPPARVPVVFYHLPPDYFRIPPGAKLIPHRHLVKHWREWEKQQRREVRDWERSYHERWKQDNRAWREWEKEKPGRGRH